MAEHKSLSCFKLLTLRRRGWSRAAGEILAGAVLVNH